MLRMALIFFLLALVSALFGFGLLAGLAWDAAKVFFFVFLVLAVIAFIADAIGGKSAMPYERGY